MDRGVVRHDHALSSWITLRVGRDGAVRRGLRIETDLSLDANDAEFRKDQLDALITAAVAYLRAHPELESIEVEQVPGGPLEVTRIGF
jgi:hypothetical protein